MTEHRPITDLIRSAAPSLDALVPVTDRAANLAIIQAHYGAAPLQDIPMRLAFDAVGWDMLSDTGAEELARYCAADKRVEAMLAERRADRALTAAAHDRGAALVASEPGGQSS